MKCSHTPLWPLKNHLLPLSKGLENMKILKIVFTLKLPLRSLTNISAWVVINIPTKCSKINNFVFVKPSLYEGILKKWKKKKKARKNLGGRGHGRCSKFLRCVDRFLQNFRIWGRYNFFSLLEKQLLFLYRICCTVQYRNTVEG